MDQAVRDAKDDISTHTPLARRDAQPLGGTHGHCHFYSHASCEA